MNISHQPDQMLLPPIEIREMPRRLQMRSVRVRTHPKKRRIDKKWKKRFGFRQELDPQIADKIISTGNLVVCGSNAYAKVMDALKNMVTGEPMIIPPSVTFLPRAPEIISPPIEPLSPPIWSDRLHPVGRFPLISRIGAFIKCDI